jgi:nitrate/nitrite transporter NarK
MRIALKLETLLSRDLGGKLSDSQGKRNQIANITVVMLHLSILYLASTRPLSKIDKNSPRPAPVPEKAEGKTPRKTGCAASAPEYS